MSFDRENEVQHDARTDRSEELSAEEEKEEEKEEDVGPTFCWYRAPLVATATVAAIGNGSTFRKGIALATAAGQTDQSGLLRTNIMLVETRWQILSMG